MIGAGRGALIRQFLMDSLPLLCIAFILALGIGALSLPPFNQLVEKKLVTPWLNPYSRVFAIAFVLFTGLLAGNHPCFFCLPSSR